jgi:hypothetical protein
MKVAPERGARRVVVADATLDEADAIARALGDPGTRALCITVGMLLPLTGPARVRVLDFLQSRLDEERAADEEPAP